jgi:hypothetical protein
MKSNYKKLMTEGIFFQAPKSSVIRINSTKDAFDFFTSKRVFGEEKIDEAPAFSSQEAKIHVEGDLNKMSKILGKASQQSIKVMMDGVKGGKYDAMDLARGIQTGPVKRAHYGEMDFIKQLWIKVKDGFRRYSKREKLR